MRKTKYDECWFESWKTIRNLFQTTAMSRDERKATGARLPISVQEIINLPMDEFNDLLSKHELSEDQLTLCRDIRRRGKNKVICLLTIAS